MVSAYQTQQRKLLHDFLKRHANQKFSVNALREALLREKPGACMDRSTVYRNVDRLMREGLLRKSFAAGSREALFQYIACGQHCNRVHLRCEKCGRIFHPENPAVTELISRGLRQESFRMNPQATIIVGLCRDCQGIPS